MPEPLLQLILGSLGLTISGMAAYIVRQWALERADLKANCKFWQDRSLTKDEQFDKALATLAAAITMAHESARGRDR